MNKKNKVFSFPKKTFVIAEAGINHNGDIDLAKQMIEKASSIGANAIKFQTVIPDELFSTIENPELHKMCEDWILTKKEHTELKKYAIKNKITFFSTPFGRKSLKILKDINVPIVKISSGDITNQDLIIQAAKLKKPIIISTGMSSISEISNAVNIIKNSNTQVAILHCISTYPTEISDTNLSTIPFLKNIFKVPVGFSDHTMGIEASLSAVSLGASIIEKHFTLDKKLNGPDQKLSLDPTEFSELIKKIRIIEKTIGNPKLEPVKSEESFKKNMRRSIAAGTDIPKNTILKNSMLTFLRPESGIPLTSIEKIVGRKSKQMIKKGTILQWKNFV